MTGPRVRSIKLVKPMMTLPLRTGVVRVNVVTAVSNSDSLYTPLHAARIMWTALQAMTDTDNNESNAVIWRSAWSPIQDHWGRILENRSRYSRKSWPDLVSVHIAPGLQTVCLFTVCSISRRLRKAENTAKPALLNQSSTPNLWHRLWPQSQISASMVWLPPPVPWAFGPYRPSAGHAKFKRCFSL